MFDQPLASETATQLNQNCGNWCVWATPLVGVVVGSVVTLFANVCFQWFKDRKSIALDKARKRLLQEMLDERPWRKLSTLSRVIGADADTTRRLLIDLEARGSETPSDDGDEVWGLISKHPLNRIE